MSKSLPTKEAWKKLQLHFKESGSWNLLDLINEDRVKKYTLETEDLIVDVSKNHFTDKTLSLLIELLKQQDFASQREALFSGKRINVSENKTAMHHVLRSYNNSKLPYTKEHRDVGQKNIFDIKQFIHRTEQSNFPDYNSIVVVGVGGSHLGVKFLQESFALIEEKPNIPIYFLTSYSNPEMKTLLQSINPDKALFFITSKSFSTAETMYILEILRNQICSKEVFENQFFAVTAKQEKAIEAGFRKQNIFDFSETIGGRYSIWSNVSLPIALAYGVDNFEKLLIGAARMDSHYYLSENENNIPVILALLDVWYQNFHHCTTRAVLTYHYSLVYLVDYLQQLEMESNGKNSTTNNELTELNTASIFWGGPGPNCQHSYMQYLHQNNNLVPIDLIGVLKDDTDKYNFNEQLLANLIAQSKALMVGQPSDPTTPPYKIFTGNRSSTTILLKKYTAEAIGALLAMYEHRIFTVASILEINPFDQWGVELGKTIANEILQSMGTNTSQSEVDESTKSLLDIYAKKK